MEQIQSLEEIGAILGALASFGAFLKWVWPRLKNWVARMFGNKQVNERLNKITEQLGFVVAEMKLNGGSSIKNHLCRIEDYVVLTNEIQHARMLDADDMIFRTDPEGNCQWVNRTYARAVQRLPQELVGHGWANAIAEDQRDRVVER